MGISELIVNVLGLFSIMCVGGILAKRNLLTKDFNQQLSKIIVQGILPISIFHRTYNQFQDKQMLYHLKYVGLVFPLIIMGYMGTTIIAKLFKIQQEKQAVFRGGAIFTNTLFMGLPLAIALFGEVSSPYVMLYYISNTIVFWTLGVYFFTKGSIAFSWRRLLPPPLQGFFVGMFVTIIGISLPKFIIVAVSGISAMATPLAMIYIGAMFFFTDFKTMKVDVKVWGAVGIKFVVYPAFVLGVFCLPIFRNLPALMKATFCLIATMPTMNQVSLVAGQYNIEKEYANTIVICTTALSVIWIPMAAMIITKIFPI